VIGLGVVQQQRQKEPERSGIQETVIVLRKMHCIVSHLSCEDECFEQMDIHENEGGNWLCVANSGLPGRAIKCVCVCALFY